MKNEEGDLRYRPDQTADEVLPSGGRVRGRREDRDESLHGRRGREREREKEQVDSPEKERERKPSSREEDSVKTTSQHPDGRQRDMNTSDMEPQTERQKPNNNNNGQLIFVPHQDTIRLLEVYVKRSLSLNDGTLGTNSFPGRARKEKWVPRSRRHRRHSSDPSIHLAGLDVEGIGVFSGVDTPSNQPEILYEEVDKPPKKSKKSKKPSFWKSLFSVFSRKTIEEEEQESSPPEISEVSQGDEKSDIVNTCLPTTPATVQKRKSTRRKSLKRRFSMRRLSQLKVNKNGSPAEISGVQDAVSVESTYSYYEKVSEELEKIVHEVKEKEEVKKLSDEEVINRIIALTKQQGDAIDNKLKDNPTLSNFFQGMSYSSFQQLADAYLEEEGTPTHNPPTVLPTAPELVKLAFTLDFTARVAGLSRQNVCHITGLGNRYLQDRFEYQQACSDHPWSDSDD
ncbi:uncharacterized protein LOC117813394 isoform X2 [Xyrichtys novacula]|uniref:Uncharacterized protein LOC117813394 isoform X2 n=1 Tax=Xyrichtys novacula TaxID=13765 RepID=A0AAV1ENF9_XYRNO|nr:uncharacterized protein LOC117813394 isoform X2 [Xyrichtys novacula]